MLVLLRQVCIAPLWLVSADLCRLWGVSPQYVDLTRTCPSRPSFQHRLILRLCTKKLYGLLIRQTQDGSDQADRNAAFGSTPTSHPALTPLDYLGLTEYANPIGSTC